MAISGNLFPLTRLYERAVSLETFSAELFGRFNIYSYLCSALIKNRSIMRTRRNETKQANVTKECKYLDPKADLTFKLVFGEHPDLVMSLLNALLPLADDGQITSVEYATPEMIPENPAKKDSMVDVRCTDQQGRQFIVEMQMYWNQYFQKRVLLNASKAIGKKQACWLASSSLRHLS